MMKNTLHPFVLGLILSIFLVASCSVYKEDFPQKAQVMTFSDGTKTIKYIPMSHVAHPDFFEDVKSIIQKYKSEGYIHYYEFARSEDVSDEEFRKVRKFLGFMPSNEGYMNRFQGIIKDKGLTVQQTKELLDIENGRDYNIDLSYSDIVREYEKRYGVIELDGDDYQTPLHMPIKNTLPSKKFNKVILEHRNKLLAKKIEGTHFDYILVTYGYQHKSAFSKELKRLNPAWKLIKKE